MGVARTILDALTAWLKAQAQNAVIVVVLFIAGFAITGVPWWLITGFLAGILNLVPHLGPLFALAIPLPLVWIATHDWLRMAFVGAVWLMIQIIDGFFLTPRAAGRAGVSPFLAIAVTLGAGFAFGPLGLLLAVPVTAITLIVLRAIRTAR